MASIEAQRVLIQVDLKVLPEGSIAVNGYIISLDYGLEFVASKLSLFYFCKLNSSCNHILITIIRKGIGIKYMNNTQT